MRFLVTGGYFDDTGECVIHEVDLHSGQARSWLRYLPPSGLRCPTKGFAGASLSPGGGALYVAAHSFLARIDLRRASIEGVLHQPCFNDLHHVAARADGTRERLWVANTGLSSIDIFDGQGCFIGSHALLPAWVNAARLAGRQAPESWTEVLGAGWDGVRPASWKEHTPGGDRYHTPASELTERPFHQTKVRDRLHPNHVGFLHGRPVVTCLYDGSVREFEGFLPIAQLPGCFPHDGLHRDDGFWLTTIDGVVYRLDPSQRPMAVSESWDIPALTGHYGWCRGLHVDEQHIVVGMTEVREGRLPKHRWSDRPTKGSETSVLCIERRAGTLVARIDLSDPDRHHKIYSLIPLERAP
jgi:hypothetical protein